MDEQNLREIIHQASDEQISESVNLWPGIKQQLTDTSPRGSRLPRTRKGWLLALLAALLTASVVAAVDQALNLRGDPGLESANQQGLVTQLNTTQTDGDASVMLEYAYADSNRITVAYNMNVLVSPQFAGSVYAEPELRDDRGHHFVAVISGGGGGGGGGEAGPTPTAVLVSSNSEFSYDVLESLGDVDSLNLTLQVKVYKSDNPNSMAQDAMLLTSFEFPFTIPFYKGLVMDTRQTVTAAGIEMNLERVVVAPSMTRVVLCYDQPPPMSDERWWPEIEMTAAGKATANGDNTWFPFTPDESANPMPENCLIETLAQDLSALKGEWTLTVPDLYTLALSVEAAQQYVLDRVQQLGVEVVPQPEGGVSYVLPEGMDHGQLGEIMRQAHTEMQTHIQGPWVFTFQMR